MAFAPAQSGLFAGIQSPLFQRDGAIRALFETWQEILILQENRIRAVAVDAEHYNPPGPYADPVPLMEEAEALPWSTASGPGIFDFVWEKFYRTAPWPQESPIYPAYADMVRDAIALDLNLRSQILVRNSDADRVFPLPDQLQTFRQACFWWKPASFTITNQPIPDHDSDWISRTFIQRSRYKWTHASHGFCALAEIHALSLTGPNTWRFGFTNVLTARGVEDRLFDALTILNVRSLPTYPWQRDSVNPNTWIEIPTQYIFNPATSAQPGYMGNIIFSVDFETKAEWTARTGVPIIPLV